MKMTRLILLFVFFGLAGCFSLSREEPPQQHYVLGESRLQETAPAAESLVGLTIGLRQLQLAEYLESLMMGVALTQVIMESKLAQYASRFNAMSSAKRRAHDLATDLSNQYHRSKRNEGDERLKEIMKVIVNGGTA